MNNYFASDNFTAKTDTYEESLAERLSLELERDSRRYSSDISIKEG